MRPRLTRPIAEILYPRSAQEARPRVLCDFRSVRRPPGAPPGRPKPEGYWTGRAVSFLIFHFSPHDEQDVMAYNGGLQENSRPVYQ